jgi:hypothetical protein
VLNNKKCFLIKQITPGPTSLHRAYYISRKQNVLEYNDVGIDHITNSRKGKVQRMYPSQQIEAGTQCESEAALFPKTSDVSLNLSFEDTTRKLVM